MCPRGTRLAIIFGMLMTCACADIIVFKDGTHVIGSVTHPGNGNIEVRMENGRMTVPEADIEKIVPEPPKRPVAALRPPTPHDIHMGELTGVSGKIEAKLEALVRAMGSGNDRDRRSARRSLVEMGKTRDISGYLRAMIEYAPSLAADLADVLAETNPRGAVEELERLIGTGNVEYRSRAIGTLMRIDAEAGLPYAAAGLADTERDVRIASATALANAKEKRATLVLIKAMRSGDRKVSNASRSALCAIWSTEMNRVDFKTPDGWLGYWRPRRDAVPGVLDPAKVLPMASGQLAGKEE